MKLFAIKLCLRDYPEINTFRIKLVDQLCLPFSRIQHYRYFESNQGYPFVFRTQKRLY